MALTSSDIISILQKHEDQLKELGVVEIGLFGS